MGKIFTFDEGYSQDGHGAVWIEENLSLWPLFKMRSKGGRPGPDEIEVHSVKLYSIDAGGNKVQASLTLRGSAGVGLPISWDQDALFAVEELLQEKGGPDEDGGLDFSLRQLVSIAGYADSGQYYDRMRASLDRIGSTWIISDKAFYNPLTESLISDRFNLWTVKFRDDRDLYSRHFKEQHRLQFHKNFLDSYEGGYGRYLDRDFYKSLHYPTSKRLYRLLSSQFAYQREWQVDPFTLRDLMLIGGYRHASRVKQAMKNAHEELTSRGFLRLVEDRKLAGGKKVLLYKSSKKYALRTREQRVLNEPEKRVAYEMLKEHGVWRSSRLSLIENHGPTRCIEASEALVRKREVRNPGAWLQRAIAKGFEFDEPEGNEVGDAAGSGKSLSSSTRAQASESSEKPEAFSEGHEWFFRDDLQESADEQAEAVLTSPEMDPIAAEVWDDVLEVVAEQINTPSFKVWFERSIPTGWDGRRMEISVPNPFAKEYIESRFEEQILDGLRQQGVEKPALIVTARQRDTEDG